MASLINGARHGSRFKMSNACSRKICHTCVRICRSSSYASFESTLSADIDTTDMVVVAVDVDRQSCNHHPRKNPGQTDDAGCREMVAASPAIAADVVGNG